MEAGGRRRGSRADRRSAAQRSDKSLRTRPAASEDEPSIRRTDSLRQKSRRLQSGRSAAAVIQRLRQQHQLHQTSVISNRCTAAGVGQINTECLIQDIIQDNKGFLVPFSCLFGRMMKRDDDIRRTGAVDQEDNDRTCYCYDLYYNLKLNFQLF